MHRMAEPEEDYVEDMAFVEGSTIPLERNRTGELALECWNMKKSIMEQSSQALQQKKEITRLKNLIKSLQRNVSEVESENLVKAREIHSKKLQILECDKKVHEVTTNNNILNSSFIRSKKLTQTLQHKLEASQRENQVLQEKFALLTKSMKDELRSQESVYSLEIRRVSEERDRHLREVAVQKTYLEESNTRVADLEATCRELKREIENQGETHNERLGRIASEQDKSYEALHHKLETMLAERDALFHRVIDKEHENHQLMSFVLMEGLQLPELLPATQNMYDVAARRYPAGRSEFVEGVAVLDGGRLMSNYERYADPNFDDAAYY